MLHRMAWLALAFALLSLPAFGGEAEGKGGPRPPRPNPGMVLKFAMDHAQDLGLTDEQKQKIEGLIKENADKKPPEAQPEGRPEGKAEGRPGRHGRGPLADILTEEQSAKLRELLRAGRPERKDKPEEEKSAEKF